MSWPFDPTVYAGLLLLGLGYGALARGRADAGRKHALYFLLGLLTIWLALETPVDTISDQYLQSVHMLQHVLIGLVAPPFFLLALSPSMVAALVRVPGLRAVTEPIPAQVAFAIVMGAWHLPALYEMAVRSEGVHVFEHLTFMVAGTLFWWPVVGATSAAASWRLGEAGKVLYLLFGTVPADTVSVILLFGRAPLYPFYVTAPRLVQGIDPLTDQVLAGVVLMVIGKLSLLVASVDIGLRWFIRTRAEEAASQAPLRTSP
ncbi:MAG TPA: cytochrome c oxidase assembly protein [Candidatus Dormibacteraeota bacterium]|nr:cytochrome c oxidase assembly protein [Candidatus Dormibacteraeota bacterium]